MTIDPLFLFVVWFVGVFINATISFVRTDDPRERAFWAGAAMVWPAVLFIALLFAPVWIALGVASLFKRKPKQ
jgi:hypothetical protein